MKVLMFGWEFPPYNVGGLGTACAGLTKGLSSKGVEVTFVIPKAPGPISSPNAKIVVADQVKATIPGMTIKEIESLLAPYMGFVEYETAINLLQSSPGRASSQSYGQDIYQEVWRFAEKARIIAMTEDFDVIHAHDWMTYPAGIKTKQLTGKPLIVHVHATEFDRTAGHPNQYIYDLEREGMHAADMVLAVSNLTKEKIIQHYGVSPDKIMVVHNGVEFTQNSFKSKHNIQKQDKVVLFLGRITIQKGPEHFLWTARKVVDYDPDIKFIIAGGGDMEPYIIEETARLGLSNNVLFAGPLKGDAVDEAYQIADLFVMPSISEPFGITPLEALRNNTPVLISKQSGVSEILNHALKVDYWDIDEMANKIIATLNYNHLKTNLADNGSSEVRSITWDRPAENCLSAYNHVLLNLV